MTLSGHDGCHLLGQFVGVVVSELAEADRRPAEDAFNVVVNLAFAAAAHEREQLDDEVGIVLRGALVEEALTLGLRRYVLVHEVCAGRLR